jgi:hypothetical protein
MQDVALLIPIIFIMVAGAVLISWIYFRSKEKQMMIEKGLSYEQMVELLKSKRNPYTLLKIGIVIAMSGIGIGLGSMDYHHEGLEGFAVLIPIVFIGLGFIGAFWATKKYEIDNNQKTTEAAKNSEVTKTTGKSLDS